jgi:hypothetical protein
MRFYFSEPGDDPDTGIDFPDADTALREAADAALALARERIRQDIKLVVLSDQGPVGTVAVHVEIKRA